MSRDRDQAAYLEDIAVAAEKAVAFQGTMSALELEQDEKTAFAIVRALEIIGEATKRVSLPIRDQYPEVPWRAMAGIRDKLIHDYVDVNLDVVWKTVVSDLPPLIQQIRAIINSIG